MASTLKIPPNELCGSMIKLLKSLRGDQLEDTLAMTQLLTLMNVPVAQIGPLSSLLLENYDLKAELKRSMEGDCYQDFCSRVVIIVEALGMYGVGMMNKFVEKVPMAWNVPYKGDAHIRLDRAIEEMTSRSDPSHISVIQSRGMGKSRTIHEVGLAGRFLISLNLSEPRKYNDFDPQYPPRDSYIFSHFQKSPVGGLGGTFLAVFMFIFEELKRFSPALQNSDLIALWKDHLRRPSPKYPRKSIREQMNDDFDTWVKVAMQELELELAKVEENLLSSGLNATDIENQRYSRRLEIGEQKCGKILEGIHSIVRKPILVVLENVDWLPKERNWIQYIYFIRFFLAMKQSQYPVSFLFSASTPLVDSTDEPFLAPDGRKHVLRETFTDFGIVPWNVTVRQDGPVYFNQLKEMWFMSRFSRPLFWAHVESGQNTTHASMITPFVSRLLMNGSDRFGTLDSDYFSDDDYWYRGFSRSDAVMIAALDIRLHLSFNKTSDSDLAERVEQTLIKNHLRVVYKVSSPEVGKEMSSGYPSDPILAEAAGNVWARKVGNCSRARIPVKDAIPDTLRKHFGRVFSAEDKECVVAKLLLTLAYDGHHRQKYNYLDNFNVDMEFSTPVPVCDFIRHLVGRQVYDDVAEKSMASNAPESKPFDEAFSHAYVRFTHFYPALGGCEGGTVTRAEAYDGMLRGMAIIGSSSTTSGRVNLVIPIFFFPGRYQEVQECRVSAILVSVKNRPSAEGTQENVPDVIDERDIGFFPTMVANGPEEEEHLPYISLTMELGMETTSVISPGAKDLPPTSPNPNFCSDAPVHPQYSFIINGCSSKVYSVIGKERIWQALMGTASFDERDMDWSYM